MSSLEESPQEKRFALLARIFVWIFFFFVLYQLRSFSVLVFLTFVFSYIQAHVVTKLNSFIKIRAWAVVLVAILFVGFMVSLGSFIIPQVIKQAETFGDNFRTYVVRFDTELVKLKKRHPIISTLIPELSTQEEGIALDNQNAISHSPTASLLTKIMGLGAEHSGTDHSQSVDIKQMAELIKNIGKPILAVSSSFFLAILFSFLIVLDLPRLTASVKELSKTKIGFIYEEVAGSIESFGKTLGHALEAQFFIALINTGLTAIAIYFFGIATKLAFLSLVVFFCSFIPVAGVFISSIPICLLVLEDNGGLQGILLVALVIWGIHLIEAYLLNPMIFGERLHINPVLVLMILTIGGKIFGVWGLLLGVPVCTYIFTDAIRYKKVS